MNNDKIIAICMYANNLSAEEKNQLVTLYLLAEESLDYNLLTYLYGISDEKVQEIITNLSRKKYIQVNKDLTKIRFCLDYCLERYESARERYDKQSKPYYGAMVLQEKRYEKQEKQEEALAQKEVRRYSKRDLMVYFNSKYKETFGVMYVGAKGKDEKLMKMLKQLYVPERIVEMIDTLFERRIELRLKEITIGTLWGFRENL